MYPIQWVDIQLPEDQRLANDDRNKDLWAHAWKTALIASGVPHSPAKDPIFFAMDVKDDYILAMKMRASITATRLVQLPQNCTHCASDIFLILSDIEVVTHRDTIKNMSWYRYGEPIYVGFH